MSQEVVARILTRDGEPGDGYQKTRTNRRLREGAGGRTTQGHRVSRNDPHQSGRGLVDGGGSVTIVNLVGRRRSRDGKDPLIYNQREVLGGTWGNLVGSGDDKAEGARPWGPRQNTRRGIQSHSSRYSRGGKHQRSGIVIVRIAGGDDSKGPGIPIGDGGGGCAGDHRGGGRDRPGKDQATCLARGPGRKAGIEVVVGGIGKGGQKTAIGCGPGDAVVGAYRPRCGNPTP